MTLKQLKEMINNINDKYDEYDITTECECFALSNEYYINEETHNININ